MWLQSLLDFSAQQSYSLAINMCQIFEIIKDLILGLHLPPLWFLLESGLFLAKAVAKYPEGSKGEARQSCRGVAGCQDPEEY